MISPSGALAYTTNYNNSDPGLSPGPQSTISVINFAPPTLAANSVVLSAGTKGGGSINAFTFTPSLTANATGNVSISNRGSVILQSSGTLHNGASGTYQVSTTPDPSTHNGQITINDTITASGAGGTINLQSSENTGTGGINQSATSLLKAASVILSDSTGAGPGSGNGAIGTLAQPITTNAANLTANSIGNVFLKDTSATAISGPSFGGQFSLIDTAKTGGIKINSSIRGFSEIDLTTSATSGTTISQSASSSLVTPLMNITLAGSSIANLSASTTNQVNKLTGFGTGQSSISLSNANNLNLNDFGLSQKVSVVVSGQLMTSSSPLSFGSLTATADFIDFGSNLIGLSTSTSVTLTALGPGILQSGAGNITAKSVTLNATAPGALIEQFGPPAVALNVTSPLVSVNTGPGGTALISDSTATPVQLTNSNVDTGFLSFTSAGSLSTKGNVAAGILILKSTGGSVTATTQAPYVIANAPTPGMNINLTSNASVTLNDPLDFTLGITAGGNFTMKVNGTVTSFRQVQAGNNVSITATNIFLQCCGTIKALNGNVLLNSNNQATGSIVLENGFTISAASTSASSGNVILSVGSANPPKTNTTAPANVNPVITPPGNIFYGKNSITSLNFQTLNNNLTANGHNIIFSTGTAPASAIVLSGNDSITASGYEQEDQGELVFVVDTGDGGE
jgi:hypothetical protein